MSLEQPTGPAAPQAAPGERRCPPDVLARHCAAILRHHGLPQAAAQTVADSLVHANLRGVDSHGVTRMGIYVERLERKLVSPDPAIRIVEDREAAFAVDGGNGMGAVVAMRALDMALERLERFGTVSVGIRNSNHYGAGAYYAERAAGADAAAFLYSNAPPTMAPWGGVDPYFGTNPYTFAVPAGRHPPIILDMATSVVARGKIILAAAAGNPIPAGWAIDAEGSPTTDAEAALQGSVLPFGGPKGYGIAMMIDVLAGVMTGAAFGPRVGDLYHGLEAPQNVGAFIQLTHVGAFMPVESFKQRLDTMIDEIKASRPGKGTGEVLVPGEVESRTAEDRARGGIPMPPSLLAELDRLGEAAGVSLQEAIGGRKDA